MNEEKSDILKHQKEILKTLKDCIINFDIDGVTIAANQAIEVGIPAYSAIMDGLSKGMDVISNRYEKGEAFLSDLILAAATMKAGNEVLDPHLMASSSTNNGIIVIGTVYEDMHDLGKNLVSILLKSAGFQVIDLGVNVTSMRFINAIKENDADVLAMSSLLTTTMSNMKETIDNLVKDRLRGKVKVLVGGAPVNQKFADFIGADAYGEDAVSAVEICTKWLM